MPPLVLAIIACILFVIASINRIANNDWLHIGWLGAAFLAGAFLASGTFGGAT